LVNGGVDQGAVGLDVLNAWRKTGLGGDRIAAFTAVDPANLDHVRLGVWAFGGVWAGFNLPSSAQAQGSAPWTVFGDDTGHAAPGSWGGHAVAVAGFDAEGLTW
ncbi:MAG: hypothetical protein JWR37_2525, partial [Mycobacterium sp.]|nr:hypothetical protein [Mycobacterium sp.]